MRRRLLPLLAGLCAAAILSTTAAPASAERIPEPPEVGTNIVGGSPAGAQQFPFTAALMERGRARPMGFTCGATVIGRSWALTAAHCVLDYDDEYADGRYGPYVAPSHFDVLTGTTSLGGTTGQRLPVAAIHAHPSFFPSSNDNDVALLRLQRPTAAPAVALIGSTAAEQVLDDAGVVASVAGWGVTKNGSPAVSQNLRYVEVPVQSHATCSGAYPPGMRDGAGFLIEYHAQNMLCAGPMSGGKDACKGDSGGPLVTRAQDGSWRQIGVVSFGLECAEPGFPGVYHRLTSSAAWLNHTKRFGPFGPDGFAYVAQQYVDFTGRPPTSAQLATWLRRLQQQPASDLIVELQASGSWDANAGMNVRLYKAAYGRNPDTSGLGFWVAQRWAGRGPVSIAQHFTQSSEFQRTYGSLSNDAFITLVYRNVFGRDPDPTGRSYWAAKLAAGRGRGQMLYELSNSREYRSATATTVRVITTRFGLLRQAPTAQEIAASTAVGHRALIDSLRTSLRYASRFGS